MLRKIVVLLMVYLLYGHSLMANAAVENIILTYQDDPRHSQSITWQTKTKDVANFLYVTTDKTKNWAKYQATIQEFVTTDELIYLHTVKLNDLKSDQQYFYEISNSHEKLEEGTFKTAGEKNPKFLIFGDSQSVNYSTWQQTLTNAVKFNPTVDFFVNVGDLVDVGQDYKQWQKFLAASKIISKNLSFVPVVGNHETYVGDGTFNMPTYFTTQLKVPTNGPPELKGQVYSFDYGQIHFVVLDSQFGEERAFVPNSLELQKQWLIRDLSNNKKPYIIVFMHRNPYHSGNSSKLEATAGFIPIFDLYKVNLVFCGHEHVVAKTYPLIADKNDENGTSYFTCGRSGTKIYNNKEQKSYHEYFYNITAQPTYFTVELNDNAFVVKAYTQDGNLLQDSIIKVKAD